MAELEGGESKVTTLIGAVASIDNVCGMDPSWFLIYILTVTGLWNTIASSDMNDIYMYSVHCNFRVQQLIMLYTHSILRLSSKSINISAMNIKLQTLINSYILSKQLLWRVSSIIINSCTIIPQSLL